jgi:hypothetical protein
MKQVLFRSFFFYIFFISCSHPSSLSDQLKLSFTSHLMQMDSALVLDSFRILDMRPMNQKIGQIIEDSIYSHALYRVKAQLANAAQEQKKDSVAFYQGEVNYMEPNVDSLTSSISKSDSTGKFGNLIRCYAQISKNSKTEKMLVVYMLDDKMNVIDGDIVDHMIKDVYQRMK